MEPETLIRFIWSLIPKEDSGVTLDEFTEYEEVEDLQITD